jgi:hypothetical protein
MLLTESMVILWQKWMKKMKCTQEKEFADEVVKINTTTKLIWKTIKKSTQTKLVIKMLIYKLSKNKKKKRKL